MQKVKIAIQEKFFISFTYIVFCYLRYLELLFFNKFKFLLALNYNVTISYRIRLMYT